MKSLSLIFYGTFGDTAKSLANDIRKEGGSAQLRHTYGWDGAAEPCDRVLLTGCVNDYEAQRLVAAFGADKVVRAGASMPPLPPPPPFDPLANLADDWRTRDDVKKLAAAVSGRAVEDTAQAVAVIESALAARAAQ